MHNSLVNNRQRYRQENGPIFFELIQMWSDYLCFFSGTSNHTNASKRIHASFLWITRRWLPFQISVVVFLSSIFHWRFYLRIVLSFKLPEYFSPWRKVSTQSINFLFVWLLKIILLCHTPSTLWSIEGFCFDSETKWGLWPLRFRSLNGKTFVYN